MQDKKLKDPSGGAGQGAGNAGGASGGRVGGVRTHEVHGDDELAVALLPALGRRALAHTKQEKNGGTYNASLLRCELSQDVSVRACSTELFVQTELN